MVTNQRNQLLDSSNNEQKQFLERLHLMRKCGLEIEAELFMNAGRSVAKQIGPELLPGDLPASDPLNGGAHLGGKLLHLVYPTPNVSLRNGIARLLGEYSSKGSLPLGPLHSFSNRFRMDTHSHEYDRDNCLMQQVQLLLGDSLTGRGYRMSMPVKQKETEVPPGDLADRLKWAMDQAAMDDKAVARGVSHLVGKKVPWQTIQGVRLGTSKSSAYLAQIAEVIKCSSGWLSTGRGEPYANRVTVTPMAEMTPAALALARRWQGLPPNLQSTLFTVLTACEALKQSQEKLE
jgi:hypothetical protein